MKTLALSGLFLLLLAAAATTSLSAATPAQTGAQVGEPAYLFLNGVPCGLLDDVSGGEIHANVIEEDQGTSTLTKKHVGSQLDYTPLILKVGFGLDARVYNWIRDFLAGRATRMSAAVYLLCPFGNTLTCTGKLQISDAAITEVTIPACDDARTEAGYLLVTIKLPSIQESPAEITDLTQYRYDPQDPSTVDLIQGANPGRWTSCNFRLQIDGLDCSRVRTIDAITISQAAATSGAGTGPGSAAAAGAVAFSNLHITLWEVTAQTWRQWANDFLIVGNNGDQNERSGHLSFLGLGLSPAGNDETDRKEESENPKDVEETPITEWELARVEFSHLGIFGLGRPPVNPNAFPRGFDLYCEGLEFSVPGSGAAGGGQPAGASGTGGITSPAGGVLTPPGVRPERITPSLTAEFARTEMPGEWCDLGKAYTLGKNSPLNVAVNSVEYSAGRIKADSGYLWPNADEKFLVVHYAIQNPLQEAQRVGRVSIDWTGVDAQDVNREQDFVGVEGTNVALDQDLKPMQTVECFTIIRVPAKGAVPKLIAAIHGDTEALVARHDLIDKVEPLPAPYADPNDPSGATLVEQIGGTVGNTYMTGAYDVKVDAVNFTKEQIGDQPLEADKDYCLVTLEYTNYGDPGYVLHAQATLKDDDDASYGAAFGTLAASSYRQIDLKPNTGETVKFRLAFGVPKGVPLQSLTLQDGSQGRPVIVDLSSYRAP